MSIFNDLRSKIKILLWLYKNAHRQNLEFHCNIPCREGFISMNRVKSFLEISPDDFNKKTNNLLKGQTQKFRQIAEAFLTQIQTWGYLQNFEYIISHIPSPNSEEYKLYTIYQTMKKKELIFSSPEVSSLYLHHGLRFAGEKIKSYIKNKIFIDAGAWEGDSASVFIKNYAPHKVYSFDISKKNAVIFEKNMKRLGHNPEQYELCLKGLGSFSETISFDDKGGDACSIYNAGDNKIEIIRLDDFIQNRKTPVGFIKADIEGSGLDMIKGCANILKKDRPVLAIYIYHNPDEFFEIKPFIESLNLNYTFELQKHSPFLNLCEIVLFAYPSELENQNA